MIDKLQVKNFASSSRLSNGNCKELDNVKVSNRVIFDHLSAGTKNKLFKLLFLLLDYFKT